MSLWPVVAPAGGWLLWCLLHSLLIREDLQQRLCSSLPWLQTRYRLAYNLFSLLTLLPVLLTVRLFPGPPVLLVCGWGWGVVAGGWMLALWLTREAARVYDMRTFLGLAPSERGRPQALVTSGILARVRHPWYSAGFLVLWLRPLHQSDLVTSCILSGYLVVGALLEEQRLKRCFGEAYRRYCRETPMFLPTLRRL